MCRCVCHLSQKPYLQQSRCQEKSITHRSGVFLFTSFLGGLRLPLVYLTVTGYPFLINHSTCCTEQSVHFLPAPTHSQPLFTPQTCSSQSSPCLYYFFHENIPASFLLRQNSIHSLRFTSHATSSGAVPTHTSGTRETVTEDVSAG